MNWRTKKKKTQLEECLTAPPTPPPPPDNWFVRAFVKLPSGDEVAVAKSLRAESCLEAIAKVSGPLEISGKVRIERAVEFLPPINPIDSMSVERMYRY